MSLLKSISKNSIGLLFLVSVILHFCLINFNSAEWGDSYRILRAAELSRTSSFYPSDEKRPPLFSLILSLRPEQMDPIIFGRITMFLVSLLSIFIFYELVKTNFKIKTYKILALVLFLFNPVYLYWSKRIYADVPFSIWVMLVAYLYGKWQTDLSVKKIIILGIISSFSVMFRFEGYLLFLSLFLAIFFREYTLFGAGVVKKNFKQVLVFSVVPLFIIGSYLVFRNPFNSTYLSEPSGRVYDLKMVMVYLVSLIFSLGIVIAPTYFILARKHIYTLMLKNYFIGIYVIFILILSLAWPAALPRLFVSILPFLIIFFVSSIQSLNFNNKIKKIFYIYSILSLLFFVVSQYLLKLQFLVVLKIPFVLLITFNLLSLIFLYRKNVKLYFSFQLISLILWSFSTLYIHKDIYRSLAEASKYTSEKYNGYFIYNDPNSVSDWYLNYSPNRKPNISGKYVDIKKSGNLSLPYFRDNNIMGMIVTNEHDPNLNINMEDKPYLVEVKDIRYNVNSRLFFTKVFIFNNHYQ